VTGSTSSTNFQTRECFDCSYNGAVDVFITNLNAGGTSIFYSTFLGGSGDEKAYGIDLDVAGNAYVTGYTASSNFPTTPDAYDQTLNGTNYDVFVSKIDYFGDKLHYSTYLGGTGIDEGKSIVLNNNSDIYIGGRAGGGFPTVAGSHDMNFNGGVKDGFISKIAVSASAVTPTPTVTPAFTPSPTPPTGNKQFELCNGLNLISLPYVSSVDTSSALLADVCPGKTDSLWKYDCVTQSFTSWNILDVGLGWDVWSGMPFWVNVTDFEGCIWQPEGTDPAGISFNLCTGLNMVSIPVYTSSISWASDLLEDVPNCTGVYLWTKIISCSIPQGFIGYFPISLPSEDFRIFPGDGLWVVVTFPSSWTPPNP
jgi:hypothetical protein